MITDSLDILIALIVKYIYLGQLDTTFKVAKKKIGLTMPLARLL